MIIQTVFKDGQPIPAKYTCSGEDVSPSLTFLNAPDGTKSFVLIVDDPDAPRGTFDHWVVWNIPPHVEGLSEGAQELFGKDSQAKQGTNGFGNMGYNGPCPPPGKPHRYFFKLYALDTLLNLKEGAHKQDVEKAMTGHILDKVEIIGTFKR